MTRTTARLTTLSVALFALLVGSTAGAEQERVDGMGRTRGWVVATDGGELGFVDCQGRRSLLGSARIEGSTQRCPTSPAPLEMTGVVRSVDPVRRIVHAEDDTGRVRAFHITADVPRLEDLKPGERIQATGPIEGQVTAIARR
jgi:hypothetical protein